MVSILKLRVMTFLISDILYLLLLFGTWYKMGSVIDCGVFVTGLPLNVIEADIETYFQVVGDVEAVLCKIDKTSNKFDGEAFIIYFMIQILAVPQFSSYMINSLRVQS